MEEGRGAEWRSPVRLFCLIDRRALAFALAHPSPLQLARSLTLSLSLPPHTHDARRRAYISLADNEERDDLLYKLQFVLESIEMREADAAGALATKLSVVDVSEVDD